MAYTFANINIHLLSFCSHIFYYNFLNISLRINIKYGNTSHANKNHLMLVTFLTDVPDLHLPFKPLDPIALYHVYQIQICC